MTNVLEVTKRIQNNHIMSVNEKMQFVKIIREFEWLYQPMLAKISEYSTRAKSVLDVACGDGYLLQLIHEKYPSLKLKGTDIDPYFIKEAKKHLPFEFIVEDLQNLSHEADIITINLALHHFDNPVEIIKKVHAKANQVLIISDHIRPETFEELEDALERRKEFIGQKENSYYKTHAKESILEAYSKKEIQEILKRTGLNYNLLFTKDYFDRCVVTIERKSRALQD